MNNLLFSALAIALIYYFFFYLPHQKKISQPTFTNQATQTMKEVADKEVQTEKDEKEIELKNKLANLREQLKTKDQTIQELKSDLADYKKQTQGWRENKKNLEEQVNLFQKHKELIGDALELHLNHSSQFLSEHSNPAIVDTKKDIQNLTFQIEGLAEEIGTFNDEEEKAELEELKAKKSKLEGWLTNQKEWLGPTNPTIQAFQKQKQKNQKIVEQCKELLEKLKDNNSEETITDNE